MGANVRCLTTFVDMKTNILHKILSSGTEAARVDTEEGRLEAPVESKGCMGSHINLTGCLHKHPTISIPPLQLMRVLSVSNSLQLLLEIALPLVITDVLDLRNLQKILNSSEPLGRVITAACLTLLDVLSRGIQDKARVSAAI